MKIAVFSTKAYDRRFLDEENEKHNHEIDYFEAHMRVASAPLAKGYDAVCVFVNDTLDESTLEILKQGGTSVIALRCAGFNNVDLQAAQRLGMLVVRVPAYSPYAVAEHTVALMLAMNRKIHRAHNRVHDGNFALDGLLGFDLHGKTVGVVGTGKIGEVFIRIMKGFGCHVHAYDIAVNPACEAVGAKYVDLPTLFETSDIISLHCPLNPDTHHMIDEVAIERMKKGVMIINTSRGGLIDAAELIAGLKTGKIGNVGLDVYEEEADLFFEDLSGKVIQDDVFARLLSFPNVIITGHQAFFTSNALQNISDTTLTNISLVEAGKPCPNLVVPEALKA
ncbi:2-hydroxyacid dehydrogenase [Leucothrix pacifica]|uniref:Hydroxyacid dehydrogenase n=1 Tax=Leucothrix pacifica TaxID=1247513 RepID=A0A317C276_9GAMM|nr:2-hydroxyacid dehydrogenase [Leucothrix pacifica]PWQ92724.1 hydroxyacid dehydrogenase [Leucothrix pacifica]